MVTLPFTGAQVHTHTHTHTHTPPTHTVSGTCKQFNTLCVHVVCMYTALCTSNFAILSPNTNTVLYNCCLCRCMCVHIHIIIFCVYMYMYLLGMQGPQLLSSVYSIVVASSLFLQWTCVGGNE